jgi:hypothetical protein
LAIDIRVSRYLIQQLVGVFFLRQRLRKQRHDGAMAQLLREIIRGRVAGDLVVFQALCRTNQRKVQRERLPSLLLRHDFVAFSTRPIRERLQLVRLRSHLQPTTRAHARAPEKILWERAPRQLD